MGESYLLTLGVHAVESVDGDDVSIRDDWALDDIPGLSIGRAIFGHPVHGVRRLAMRVERSWRCARH